MTYSREDLRQKALVFGFELKSHINGVLSFSRRSTSRRQLRNGRASSVGWVITESPNDGGGDGEKWEHDWWNHDFCASAGTWIFRPSHFFTLKEAITYSPIYFPPFPSTATTKSTTTISSHPVPQSNTHQYRNHGQCSSSKVQGRRHLAGRLWPS
jgi:hypothetical protein